MQSGNPIVYVNGSVFTLHVDDSINDFCRHVAHTAIESSTSS
jgi:hypothetical protein